MIKGREVLFGKLALLLMGFALLYAVHPGEYLRWDDRTNIKFNPLISGFKWSAFWNSSYYYMYVPVTYTVWAFVYRLSSSPMAFHALNLLIHLLNALLVFHLARRITRLTPASAAIAAAVFFAHPLQMEAVGWISGTRDLLSAFFCLSALYLFLGRGGVFRLSLAVALFALGLLSKPSGAALPLAALALVWMNSRITFSGRKFITLGLFFAMALGISLATRQIQIDELSARLGNTSWLDRLWTTADSIGFYFSKFLLPIGLTSDYGRTLGVTLHQWQYVPITAFAFAFLFLKRGEWRLIAMSILLMLPTSGLIPFQAQADNTVADRYAYLAIFPLALFVGAVLERGCAVRIGAALVAILFTCSLFRIQNFRTNRDFFSQILTENPRSTLALTSLAIEEANRGDNPKAEKLLREADSLAPKKVTVVANLAQVYWFEGKTEPILHDLYPLLSDQDFLRQNRNEERGLSVFYFQIARAMWKTGDFVGANEYYCRFLQLDPDNEIGRTETGSFFNAMSAMKVSVRPCRD